MEMIFKFLLGIIFLVLGFPLGNFLAKITKEELNSGKIWFKLIIFFSILGVFISLILKNDYLLFTFLFIMIITSRCLGKNNKKRLNHKKGTKKSTKKIIFL